MGQGFIDNSYIYSQFSDVVFSHLPKSLKFLIETMFIKDYDN